MKKNKLTYNLDKMMDGYDGITQQDYKWQIVDDPKGNHKYCYEVRIFRHEVNPPSLGNKLKEIQTDGETIN